VAIAQPPNYACKYSQEQEDFQEGACAAPDSNGKEGYYEHPGLDDVAIPGYHNAVPVDKVASVRLSRKVSLKRFKKRQQTIVLVFFGSCTSKRSGSWCNLQCQ
jgi:hypothetical protein